MRKRFPTALIAAIFWSAPSAVLAQDKNDNPTPYVFVQLKPRPAEDLLKNAEIPDAQRLLIRPNQKPINYLFYIANPTLDADNYFVELRDSEDTLIGESPEAISVGSGKSKLVKLVPPVNPSDPKGESPSPRRTLKSGMLKVVIFLGITQGTKIVKSETKYSHPLTIEVLDAEKYVQVERTAFTNGKLTFDLRFIADSKYRPLFLDPMGADIPVEVILNLDPIRVPGLTKDRAESLRTKAKLSEATDSSQLTATGLTLPALQKSGQAAITVDGVGRAFVYDFTEGENTPPQRFTKPAVWITSPEAVGSSINYTLGKKRPRTKDDKQIYPIVVETANLKPDAMVEMTIKTADNATKEQRRFAGDRARPFAIAVEKEGTLAVEGMVKDWTYDFNTGDAIGKLNFEAIFDNQTEQKSPPFTLVVDDTPPIDLVLEAPSRQVQNRKFTVKAKAKDPESDIADAYFYVGPKEFDVRDRSEWTKGTKTKEGDIFTAELSYPSTGPSVKVTVAFVNNVGLSATDTKLIEVVREDGTASSPSSSMNPKMTGGNAGGGDSSAAGSSKKGKITGFVKIGAAVQPGLTVVLRNEKGEVVATTQSASEEKPGTKIGQYTFYDVEPGTYRITSSKGGVAKVQGGTTVTVPPPDKDGKMKPVIVNVDLKR